MEQMKALVWNNPYGALMLPPYLKQETRTRPTKVRGLVLICTALKPYDAWKLDAISGEAQCKRMVKLLHLKFDGVKIIGALEQAATLNGFAIGVGELYDCIPMDETHEQLTFVKHDLSTQRYIWKFRNVRRIEPFAWKFGKQGWLNVPKSEVSKIEYR